MAMEPRTCGSWFRIREAAERPPPFGRCYACRVSQPLPFDEAIQALKRDRTHPVRVRVDEELTVEVRARQARISGIVLLVLSQLPHVVTFMPITCCSVRTSSVTLRPGRRTWRLPGSLPPAWPISTIW